MLETQVNYLAVLVTGIVLFVLGGLWYSPVLFGKKWLTLVGVPEAELRRAGTPVNYLLVLVAEIVTAYVLALAINWSGVTDPAGGALVGFLLWLGLAGATTFMTYTFSARPRGLWLIDTLYTLVAFVVGGVILSLWK